MSNDDDVTQTSIPRWEFAADYYSNLLRGEPLEIKTDPLKGKGLFAKKAFEKGDNVLVESALGSSQNLDDFNRNIPVCGMCMVSLETPKAIVRRNAGKGLTDGMPHIQNYRNRHQTVHCKNAETGCTMVFCSHRCRDTAVKTFHFACCPGLMTEEEKTAFEQFTHNNWVQDGIDLSDTHFLALRFLSTALTRHRLHKFPLEQAYLPVGQLIHAPIDKFVFTFLLIDDWEKDHSGLDKDQLEKETPEQKRERRWKHFQQYKADQTKDPIFLASKDEDGDKGQMAEKGLGMLRTMLRLTPEEQKFFTAERWSHLLGAVLLNGQERAPCSPYTEYTQFVKKFDKGDAAIKAFVSKVKQSGQSATAFDGSTRGQGIYTIGACFNHSCVPNLQVSYVHENDETLVAVALRDIKEGEELFISYIEESMPFVERQTQLFEHYLFDCACPKCGRQKKAREEGRPEDDGAADEEEESASEDQDVKKKE